VKNELATCHSGLQRRGIENIPFYDLQVRMFRRKKIPAASGEIVIDDDLRPSRKQFVNDMASDKTCPAGDESRFELHRRSGKSWLANKAMVKQGCASLDIDPHLCADPFGVRVHALQRELRRML
jgi:hypothetical protein